MTARAAASRTLRTLLLSSALLATPAWAQDARADAEEDDTNIVVTGSRLSTIGDTPAPVVQVTRETIEARATTNIAALINELPQFRALTSPQAFTASVFTGTSTLDLHGLGGVRTLVLLDGKRIVPTATSGATDLNLLPASLIERFEVVTGGASAAYGSDAVAGAVNIITRRIKGIEGVLQGGASQYGDAQRYQASLAWGGGFAENRGYLSIAVDYMNDKGAGSQNTRPWYNNNAVIANPNFTATNGQPQRLLASNLRMSTISGNGLIASGPLRGIEFLPGGGTRQFTFGTLLGPIYMVGGDGIFPAADKIPLSYPVERFSIYGRGEYELTSDVKLSLDSSYSQVEWGSESFAPTATPFTIRRDNAYLPASVRAAMDTAGVTTFTLGRELSDISIYDPLGRTESFRIVTALEWQLSEGWKLDGYYQFGKVNTSSSFAGSPVTEFLNNAIDAVVGPGGAIVCRSTLTNPTNGCVPVNLFGAGSPSAAAIEYINEPYNVDRSFRQHVGAITLTGRLFDLGAGPVGVAVGYEHRDEYGAQLTDPIQQAGRFLGGSLNQVIGGFNVDEFFGEIDVPLLREKPFAHELSFNAAVRHANYSTAGNVVTWKFGASWAPIADIRFRGTISRDARAPSTSDLFSQQAAGLSTLITDPFNGNAQALVQNVTGGNVGLGPEKSDAWTLGVVLRPSFIPNLALTADWYDIEINGAIGGVGSQNAINRCFAGETVLCGLFTRNAAGVLTQYRSFVVNLSSQKHSGLDAELRYDIPIGTGRRLTLGAAASYIESITTENGGVVTVFDGGVGVQSFPKWRGQASLTYVEGPFRGFLQGRWIGGGRYSNQFPANGIDDDTVDGQFLVNASLQWDISKREGQKVSLFVSVDNVFNAKPPLAPSTFVYPTYTNPILYEHIGRSFAGGVRFKF